MGTRTTTTSHARTCHIHRRHNNYVAFSLLTSLLLLYIPSYVTISLTPFYTTHAPCPPQQQLSSGNNKIIHNQGVGERSEPHSLYILYIDIGDMQTVQKSSSNDIHTGSYCEFFKVEVNVDPREPTVTINHEQR